MISKESPQVNHTSRSRSHLITSPVHYGTLDSLDFGLHKLTLVPIKTRGPIIPERP